MPHSEDIKRGVCLLSVCGDGAPGEGAGGGGREEGCRGLVHALAPALFSSRLDVEPGEPQGEGLAGEAEDQSQQPL